jgi:hypothetical protein
MKNGENRDFFTDLEDIPGIVGKWEMGRDSVRAVAVSHSHEKTLS